MSATTKISVRLAPVRAWVELECSTVLELRELVAEHVRAYQPAGALTLCHLGEKLAEGSLAAEALIPPVVVAHWEVAPPPRADPPRPTVSKAVEPAGDEDEEDELVCRFCFSGAEYGRLLAPCRCAGTMRYVHASCLNEWRLRSTNPSSYVRCDQCTFVYVTRKTHFARYLESKAVHVVLSACALVLALLAGALLLSGIEQPFYRLVQWDPRARGNPRLLRWLAGPRLDRLIAGFLAVALAGLGTHVRTLLRLDQLTRENTLRALVVTIAMNGPRIFRLFAVFGVLHYLGYATMGVQQRVKLLMLKHGEVLANAPPLPGQG